MSTSQALALVTFISLFTSAYSAPSQACLLPNRSPIDWRPTANETKVFQIGTDPDHPREIRVSVPPLYNGSNVNLPLILAFHDKEQSPAEFEYATRFSDREFNKDKILVYPKAVNDTWQSDITVRRWQKDRKKDPKPLTDDVTFTRTLIKDLETVICFDTTKVYATGLGTGGGMVHLLACDPEVSTKLAAYAIVAGGFGTKAVAPVWAECKPARLPAPILEIHGEEDKVLPYLLNDWEPAKSRMAVPHWFEEWSERNGCGEAISDPIEGMDGTGTPVTVTKLEGGGWVSEAEAYGGGILRTAKSCPILGQDKAAEANKDGQEAVEAKGNDPAKASEAEKEAKAAKVSLDSESKKDNSKDEKEEDAKDEKRKDTKDDNKEDTREGETLKTDPAHFTLLHYRIRDFGHGWPLQQIKGRKSSKEGRIFDTTDLVVDWFNIHKLPEPEPAKAADATSEILEKDVEEPTTDEILEPIDIDAAPVEELKPAEPKASQVQERVKQSLEEDHDEL